MSDKIDLSTFPSSKSEALTMLYLQNQDLSQKSPEEIYNLYRETLEKVREADKVWRKNNPIKFKGF